MMKKTDQVFPETDLAPVPDGLVQTLDWKSRIVGLLTIPFLIGGALMLVMFGKWVDEEGVD